MSWIIGLAVGAALAVIAYLIGRRFLANRGTRLVQCPENEQPAAVDVDAFKVAVGGRFELSDCSRWPEKSGCGRECLHQIERSPEGCLVRTMVTEWYLDKNCGVCGKPVGHIDWLERKPALMDRAGVARPWQDVAPETLPAVLSTHTPVCFDCYVAETFRREHPELVLDNPWRRVGN